MHLIQILLPVRDQAGQPFPKQLFDDVRADLAAHFGGVTAFTRSPADGVWEQDGELVHDDVVIFEVMTDHIEREFWRLYRLELQQTFNQDLIPIRAQKIDLL